MFAPACRGRLAGIAAGYSADLLFGDPRRGHPVALFGSGAAALERLTYADSRRAGVLHAGALLGALGALGVAVDRAAGRRGRGWTAVTTAAATFVALGGTSLSRTGHQMADLLEAGDVEGARRLLPSLCGRDPAALDSAGWPGRRWSRSPRTPPTHTSRRAVGRGRRGTRGFGVPRRQHA